MLRSEPVVHRHHQGRGPRRDPGIEPIGLRRRPEGEAAAVKVHHQRQCALIPEWPIHPHRQGAVAQGQRPLLDGNMTMGKPGNDARHLRGAQSVQPISRGDQFVVGQFRERFGRSAHHAKQANSPWWVRCHRRILTWLARESGCATGSGRNKRVATRSRMHTFSRLTGHKSPADHYRHMSQLPPSMRRRLPGNRERCDIVGDSAIHVGICGVDGRCRTHGCNRPRATGECHSLCGTRSEYRPPGQFGTHARAAAGRPATDRAQAA